MGHFYKNKNEKIVPSVTTILKLLHKDGIAEWANSLGFKHKSYTKILNEKAILGTLVHKAIECELLNKPREKYLIKDIEDKIERHLEIFRKWISDSRYSFSDIKTEITYTSDLYAGTADCICKLNDSYVLIDWKTSKKIYPTQMLQVSAYLELIHLNDKELYNKIENVYIVAISENNCEIKWINKKQAKKYILIFKVLVKLFYQYNELLKTDWNSSLEGDESDS